LDNGIKKSDRTGTGTLSVFGRQIRHKMSEGFPLLTTKKMYWKGIVTELIWFLRGDTNIKYLVDNDCHIWDGDAYKSYCKNCDLQDIESRDYEDGQLNLLNKDEFINKIKTDDEFAKEWGELGPVYGKQWRSWGTGETVTVGHNGQHTLLGEKVVDQIANLINDLKTNPDSRRLMVSAWNVGELDKMTLPPCHYGFQVYTRELSLEERNQWFQIHRNGNNPTMKSDWKDFELDQQNIPKRAISLMYNARSQDVPLGTPFNLASYGLLLEIIAKEVNMVPDELIVNIGDAHIYLNQIDGVKEQLTREPYKLPKLICKDEYWYLNDVDISFSEKIEKFKPDFFKVEDYQSHPTIKIPLSN
jgi:thymidylate synthase